MYFGESIDTPSYGFQIDSNHVTERCTSHSALGIQVLAFGYRVAFGFRFGHSSLTQLPTAADAWPNVERYNMGRLTKERWIFWNLHIWVVRDSGLAVFVLEQ